MRRISDQQIIFDRLADAKELPSRYDRNAVIAFPENDHFLFALFVHEGSQKGFVLFELTADPQHEDWKQLTPALQQLYDEGYAAALIEEAVREAEAQLLRLQSGRQFFDAH
jgi:hypothetical protein